MATLKIFWQFLSNSEDYFDPLIKCSNLADLDALVSSEWVENSGRVAEQIIFSLVRELYSFRNQFNNLFTFFKTSILWKRPSLHIFDEFIDQYLYQWIKNQPHKTAIVELSHVKMPKLGGNNDFNWINATHLEESLIQELQIQDQFPRPSSNCTSQDLGTKYLTTIMTLFTWLY